MLILPHFLAANTLSFIFTLKSEILFSMVPSFLSRENIPLSVNIPTAVSKLHPLPEEELMTAYNRGNAYLISGQFADALREFNRAADISPNTADVFLSRGIVKEKLFEWQGALDDYRYANELFKKRPFSGDDPTCFSNIANAETGLDLWEDALKDYTYASRLRPDFVAPQLGRALVLYQLDKPKESVEYFKQLTIKYPAFADAQAALAVMLYEQGGVNNEDALDRWEIATEQDSRYMDVDWVENIRRWPPKLVHALEIFKKNALH
eukprot:gene1220-2372_t